MDKKAKIALLSALVIVALIVATMALAARGPKEECRDKIDNDGDGNVDLADSGCDNKWDNDETDCGDGVCEGGETAGSCPVDCGEPDSCSDTDGGNYPNTFGTTSGYYNNNPYSNDDYCVDSNNVMEYYCSGDYEQSSQENCGTDTYGSPYCTAGDEIYIDFTDYFCTSGECDSDVTPVFQEDCDDYDNYGTNYCMNGSVFRDFNDYYCTGGACDFTATPGFVEVCDNPYVCVLGECIIPDSCADTDGGWNPEVQGITSGYYNENPYSYDDLCLDNTTIVEYYCTGVGANYAYNWTGSCLIGNQTLGVCSNGACTY